MDVRHLCQERFFIDGIVGPDMEFGITTQQHERHHHDPGAAMLEERLPCPWTQRNRVEEATPPNPRDAQRPASRRDWWEIIVLCT